MSEITLNNEVLNLLLTHNNDAIVMIDSEGLIKYQSPSCQNLLGYSPSEILGTQGATYYHPDDMEMFTVKLNECLSNPGKPIFYPSRVKHRNGDFLWCEGTMTNFLEHPDAKCIIGNFRDINEKKKYTDELESKINQLKKVSWEQSHLVRAPLANILGAIDLLSESKEIDPIVISNLKASAAQFDQVIRKIVNTANQDHRPEDK